MAKQVRSRRPRGRGMRKYARRSPMRRMRLARRALHGPKYFEEKFQAGSLVFGAGGTGGIFKVALNQLPNYPQIKQLFDLYCIKGFTVHLVPRWTQADQNTAGYLDITNSQAASAARIVFADNCAPGLPAPGNLNDILGEDNSKIKLLTGNRIVKLRITNPKPLLPAYVGATGVYVESKPLQWIMTGGSQTFGDGSAVEHYGIPYWVDAPGNINATTEVDVFYTVRYMCKEQH